MAQLASWLGVNRLYIAIIWWFTLVVNGDILTNDLPTYQPPYTLSVVSVFKDENHIIVEWLEHYLAEGVQHFYLVDNQTRNQTALQACLERYKNKGLITIYQALDNHNQALWYHDLAQPDAVRESEFLIVVDLDEFMYARGDTNLRTWVKTWPQQLGQWCIPWSIFGSQGHHYQPRCVVPAMTHRQDWGYSSQVTAAKCIARSTAVASLYTHAAYLKPEFEVYPPHFRHETTKIDVNETYLAASPVHINHYRTQSYEFFKKVKMTRGGASNKDYPVRDENYFRVNNLQTNSLQDVELAEKRHWDHLSCTQPIYV